MAHNRYAARRHIPPASGLVLGVRPIFLIAALLCGVTLLWTAWTVLVTAW